MLAFQRQTYLGGGLEFGYERVFEHEFGRKRTATTTGAFYGPDSERSADRSEIYGFIETSPIKQVFFLGVLSYQKGVLDYDFGAGRKFPRVSQAYLDYLISPEYLKYLHHREINPNDPTNTKPNEPGLDPGAGDMLFIESSLRYQPTAALQAQLNYNLRRLTRNDTGRVAFLDKNLDATSPAVCFGLDAKPRNSHLRRL
jgi:hypothetical protein